MKKRIARLLKWLGLALLTVLIGLIGWRLLYGRGYFTSRQLPERVELTYAEAMADGVITHEELAVHYAPEINAAVNVLLSGAGRGDFLAAVDYDGDWITLNNWENLNHHPLEAVVYYSVQETESHWFVGYYFYHPRDDAEIWLDRHENDMEGVMLAIPRDAAAFLPPQVMYTQAHGLVPFCLNEQAANLSVMAGNRDGGVILLDGDRPVVYITPNGTLDSAGHSVESAAGHTIYWSVGNSGVRYYHGGTAMEPASFNGAYEKNRCSYALRPLKELWARRGGPFGDESIFGQFGAFRGDNWGADKANPPWGWRNKTAYGFGGAFLSDPAWTITHAVAGTAFDAAYTDNAFGPWRITVKQAVIPGAEEADGYTLHLFRDGWEFSDPAWFTLTKGAGSTFDVTLAGGRQTLYAALPAGGAWRMEVRNAQGAVVPGASVAFTAEYATE